MLKPDRQSIDLISVTKSAALPLLLIALTLGPRAALAVDVRVCTARGAIDVELDDRRAPLHTANFVRYAQSGFYNGTILHRAVPGSMVQGGSYDTAFERRTPGTPVQNESANGLSNRRGTIAAARSDDPNSATSQFFFNLGDNSHLDARPGAPGYTVFGRVTAGLEVLDAVSSMPTGRAGNLNEVPLPVVVVESVVVLDRAPVFGLSIEPDPNALQRDFDLMQSRGDAAGILRAVDALKASCIELSSEQRLAEAEAAGVLGLTERSRNAAESYIASANRLDPSVARAQRLLAGLPPIEPSRDLDSLISHCRRPVAPSIPDGFFTELATMRAVETAVLQYRDLARRYLGCVSDFIEREELDDIETAGLTDRHNDVVVELTAVLTRFNQAVRTFRETH